MKDLKAKIHKSMREYLDNSNWKQGDDQKIFNELPQIWKKLETDGLMPQIKAKGMNFQHFLSIAQKKHREIKLMEKMQKDFESMFGKRR